MEETGETISSILASAMETRGFSIDDLSEETGIPERFIELLLSEKFNDMPPAPYTHGYIVKISEVLDLDGEEIWKKYLKDKKEIKKSGKFDKLPENRFAVSRLNKKALLIGLAFILLAGYFILRSVFSVSIENKLHVTNLEESPTVATSSAFTVEGNIDSQYQLTINQTPVYPNSSGNFEKEINLQEGLNNVVFNIKGLLGKEGEVVKQIFYRTTTTESNQNLNTNGTTTPVPPIQ